jgi:hypothetical protein
MVARVDEVILQAGTFNIKSDKRNEAHIVTKQKGIVRKDIEVI